MLTLKALIDGLKLASQLALKNKDTQKRAIFSTIIADLQTDGKDPDETVGLDKAFAALKSYKKGLDAGGDMQPYIDVIEPLLPRQLTKDELLVIVAEQGFTNMGTAMKWFKQPENKDILFEPAVLFTIFKNK